MIEPDELRDQIRTLADTAGIVAAACRSGGVISIEDRRLIDWMADELSRIDMALSVEALRT